ncbi:uncharacterized protein LOC118748239 [Rhagoletis pomonella]|uniref:uncharacterized protein LOC118748239 n=1 Tax=Rhagoletis pomonella TaxID=28610 RepID=UPI00177F3F45|nr:uncharacterized protein LOC118748239 [Rhagoletis pomonella]
MSALKNQNFSRGYRFAAMQMLLLLVLCAYCSLVSMPRFALAIESLEATSATSNSVEDLEEGFVAATLLAKDTILKKDPANIGNKLKDLWEKVPEHVFNGVDIKK